MGPEVVASPQIFNVYQALLQFGLAGALLAVVIVPTLRWIMSEASESRREFTKILQGHIAVLTEIKQSLDILLERCYRNGEGSHGSNQLRSDMDRSRERS